MVQVRAGAIEANIKSLIVEGPLGAVAKKAIETIAVQREQENENAYNLDTVKVQKTEENLVDDTDGIPEAAVSKLRVINYHVFFLWIVWIAFPIPKPVTQMAIFFYQLFPYHKGTILI